MSCTNPSLLQVVDIRKGKRALAGYHDKLQKMGFLFNKEKTKAYHFAANKSQSIPLEDIDDWQQQKLIELPCGSCLSCRLDYSQDWAVRCSFESKLWKHNYFITLSYDDENLPFTKNNNATLDKSHIDEFIQAVRNYFKHRGHTGIRYLLCGEYNSSGDRMLNPHYHMILFNCPLDDLTINFPTPDGGLIHKKNSVGTYMFYSPIIADIWSKGFIAIDDANFNTESYVSRYIMKKQKGESSKVYSEVLGVEAPFLRMSNRPGIGFNYFLKDEAKYIDDPTIILPSGRKPIVSGLPKYFKRKLFEKDSNLRDKFEVDAKANELRLRSIRKAYKTSSNEQKVFKEKHLESITSVFERCNTE